MQKITSRQYAEALFQTVSELSKQSEIESCLDNFVKILVLNRDRKKLPDILRIFGSLYSESGKNFEIIMTLTEKLDDAQVSALEKELVHKLGADVSVSVKEDPSIIGGAIVRVNDTVYDGSVKHFTSTLFKQLVS